MKGKNKFFILPSILLMSVFLLSGCAPADGKSNFFTKVFVEPFSSAIHFLGEFFGGNYGMAIILITLMIRLILMPLMLKQYKNQLIMKGKMDSLKPEMDELQKKIKAEKDAAKQKELQSQMFGLYQKHGVNPLNMGCLPILIQMPILTGFYYAIRSSAEIASHNFLWFSLGSPDIAITLIAGIVYFLQFKVSQSSMPAQQQQQMKFMGLLSPIMIVMFSLNAPAALPLYWAVGGTFLILQTLISRHLYKNPVSSGSVSVQK
ncbi:membrane protein insertase YidC [Neobacillus notoginsengisoli]|uniref:Membrane protein insertase YidC n=1 Tax=Neobacillus notoginsengisoli TaxID=1578198 RepID=A0A417YX99_9BACI|nr:membrane protein insertase YidC [Neobacillus notoginsengisoli]RHW42223.1 membrane protein insertase YidC [Neobacillus notoginsengisoli]